MNQFPYINSYVNEVFRREKKRWDFILLRPVIINVALRNRLTVGHDLLSYEVVDRFDRERFLANLTSIRLTKPENHEKLSKAILEENKKYSYPLLGPTNIVLLIATTITLFGDLRTTITALNSFGSDSLLLWCMKHIYVGDEQTQRSIWISSCRKSATAGTTTAARSFPIPASICTITSCLTKSDTTSS